MSSQGREFHLKPLKQYGQQQFIKTSSCYLRTLSGSQTLNLHQHQQCVEAYLCYDRLASSSPSSLACLPLPQCCPFEGVGSRQQQQRAAAAAAAGRQAAGERVVGGFAFRRVRACIGRRALHFLQIFLKEIRNHLNKSCGLMKIFFYTYFYEYSPSVLSSTLYTGVRICCRGAEAS